MADQIIKVKNMHCPSCIRMIQLELEEDTQFDLTSKIESIRVTDPDRSIGEVVLHDARPEEVVHAKQLINGIGSYQVIE